MSVATQISRLQTAKADIKTAIEDKGVAVPSSAKIDVYDDYIRAIATNETIVINLTTNQNSSYNSDLIGATVTITNNTESTTVLSTTWNGTAIQQEIEAGVNYTVSVGSRTGYKTPSSVTYTSKVGIRNLTFQYKTEVITVTVNTDVSGVTVQGQVITINGANYTVGSSGVISAKIAYDTVYSVSANKKDTYITPSTQSFTASQTLRSVTMTYKYAPLGIWAYYSDGSLKSYDNADTNAIGVAVITNNCRFVIDKVGFDTNYAFGGIDKDLSSTAVTTTDESLAKADFNGLQNTINIINACAGYTSSGFTGAPAAEACRARFNRQGHLGSLGEWNEAYINKTDVNNMMSKIGGTEIIAGALWASTHYDATRNSWKLVWNTGYVGQGLRSYSPIRAFLAI